MQAGAAGVALLMAQRSPAAVVVSSGELGAIPRIRRPLRWIAGWRGRRVDRELEGPEVA